MHYQVDVSAQGCIPVGDPTRDQNTDLLRQILEVQKEQRQFLRALLAHQDHLARWRYLAHRWQDDFPNLPAFSREVLPTIEKAYGGLLASLVEELRQEGEDAVGNDFALQELLDRHGPRLGQLGHLLGLLGLLTEAGRQNELAKEQAREKN